MHDGPMTLTTFDWAVIAAYFVISMAIGLYFYRRAGQGPTEFFLSGRRLPWWLAGTSMVATTFAADTPLAITGIVAREGIAGNWIWWNAAIGSMLTVMLFARLWRRAGVVTDVEFAELRYSGGPGAFLRGFRALYLGLPINCLIIGWVNLAMAKILAVTLGWDRMTAVLATLSITGLYTAVSGLWGVVVTDFFQFSLAMMGTTVLAWYALEIPAIGGLDGLLAALPPSTVDLVPSHDAGSTDATLSLPLVTFATYLGVQWWASWYPGQEPGGGGYVVQRVLSARDERHAFLATLWYTLANFCVRPWPWVIVGLVSIVLYPELVDKESGYVLVLRDHLPPGWRGLLIGAFFAAYMSTVGTQLNWGTSYLVNDVYRRFFRPSATDAHYVLVSRVATVLVMVLAGGVTFYLESIRQAWEFILESGAGIGLVLLLRWYWWRINAWSEIAAMIAPALGFLYLKLFTLVQFPFTLLYLAAWTAAWAIVVTLLTPPEPNTTLDRFYRRVRPPGPGWAPVARRCSVSGVDAAHEPMGGLLVDWLAGCALVYGCLLGLGALLFDSWQTAAMYGGVACAAGWLLYRDVARRGWAVFGTPGDIDPSTG